MVYVEIDQGTFVNNQNLRARTDVYKGDTKFIIYEFINWVIFI